MTSAAIYARVSSARQKKDQTIGSQTAALREHATQNRLEVPEEWVFEDEGHSGATLVRPGLAALRDLAAQGCVDVVLVWSLLAHAEIAALAALAAHKDRPQDAALYTTLHPCPICLGAVVVARMGRPVWRTWSAPTA